MISVKLLRDATAYGGYAGEVMGLPDDVAADMVRRGRAQYMAAATPEVAPEPEPAPEPKPASKPDPEPAPEPAPKPAPVVPEPAAAAEEDDDEEDDAGPPRAVRRLRGKP